MPVWLQPANRMGYTGLSLPQLKILQEVATLIVFVPFADGSHVFHFQEYGRYLI